MTDPSAAARVTVTHLAAMKARGEPICVLTAYDYPTARLLDQAGVDLVLVGDSLGQVVQGNENTLPVTLQEMIYHGRMVARAVRRAMVVVDMPFPMNRLAPARAVDDAARVLKQTGAQGVKFEGGVEMAELIAAVVDAGIPVMGHIGLKPQSVHKMGGYKIARDLDRLLADARALEQAGVFSMVLECVAALVAGEITKAVGVPTIGIGSGPQCDAQVLVLYDMLGLTAGRTPSFVKQYADLNRTVAEAVGKYCDEVRGRRYPTDEHSFS